MKRKFLHIAVVVAILMVCFIKPTYGIENREKVDLAIEEDTSNYSEAYKEYLELSDEEKAKVAVIPRKYNIPLDSIYEDTIKVEKKRSISNLFGFFKQYETVSTYADELPEYFNLRDEINIPTKHQSNYGLCWDFASIRSLETNLALHGYGDYDLSELHLDYLTSEEFYKWKNQETTGLVLRHLHDGGNFEIFEEYCNRNDGPVWESEVPYDAVYTEDDYDYLESIECKVFGVKTINFPTIYKDDITDEELELFRDKVKKHIMENGSLYCVIATPDFNRDYYNAKNSAEYYNGDYSLINPDRPVHAVSIIGWDDNYSRENFNEELQPEHDGAYIIANSWGDWDIIYVSYDDFIVERDIAGVISASPNIEELIGEIAIEDENLYKAIKENLGKRVKEYNDTLHTLKIIDIEGIKSLNLSEKNISNLSGIENFRNLTTLSLSHNMLNNIDSLATLTELTDLNISNNNLEDISALENLKELKMLNVAYNNIENINVIN